MTSSVQSHLPSERCLYKRQWPLQEHAVFEDFGVVAGGERSGWSHACTHPLDVSALSIEAPPHASLSVETSAHASLSVETSARTPDWDVGAASRGGAAAPLRSTNHAHCFAEAIVTRAAGLHRRHARTKSHSAPDSGNGQLGAGKSLATWWASRHHHTTEADAAKRLPCGCHAVAMQLPCSCHAVAMQFPCCCHAVA